MEEGFSVFGESFFFAFRGSVDMLRFRAFVSVLLCTVAADEVHDFFAFTIYVASHTSQPSFLQVFGLKGSDRDKVFFID